MTNPQIIEQHGSRIIAALEHAWAAIQDSPPRRARRRHRDRGRVQPERHPRGLPAARPPLARTMGPRRPGRSRVPPSCSSPGSCWRPGAGRSWRSCCTRPPTPWPPGAASKTPAPPGTATTTSGSSPSPPSWACAAPTCPDKITGWSHCTLHGQAAYDAWAEVTAGIDAARLPFLIDLARPARPGGGDGGAAARTRAATARAQPAKRGGRRVAVECACQPEPRRLQLTPKQIEDGPIICGLCRAPFELPEDDPGPAMTARPAPRQRGAMRARHAHATEVSFNSFHIIHHFIALGNETI